MLRDGAPEEEGLGVQPSYIGTSASLSLPFPLILARLDAAFPTTCDISDVS